MITSPSRATFYLARDQATLSELCTRLFVYDLKKRPSGLTTLLSLKDCLAHHVLGGGVGQRSNQNTSAADGDIQLTAVGEVGVVRFLGISDAELAECDWDGGVVKDQVKAVHVSYSP
ncbi:hypothetical protein [Candidatus Accumulibacter vicinus]|uniref:Uncharacterized protein n=1 Tax=Candidatus Accumulibacter vicinus TaxID=2954382 RepID=A0A084XUH2_9PROT|nr:hypothetical protein [Candidatus Accumulibacter vicinus]KFB66116.1 MAG: hypothetical protein CAPSK01_004611 [Candidatus Accumulibacter vicinus]